MSVETTIFLPWMPDPEHKCLARHSSFGYLDVQNECSTDINRTDIPVYLAMGYRHLTTSSSPFGSWLYVGTWVATRDHNPIRLGLVRKVWWMFAKTKTNRYLEKMKNWPPPPQNSLISLLETLKFCHLWNFVFCGKKQCYRKISLL